MVKVFTPNKDGKIEFTKQELEALLNEVWNDGYYHNSSYYWTSPTWTSPTISPTITPYYTVSCSADMRGEQDVSDK